MYSEFKPKRPVSSEQSAHIEKMLAEIGKKDIKAVSFKLTDTLVITPFSEFDDLFMFMEDIFSEYYSGKKKFASLRTAAQEAAEKKIGNKGCVTLESIYEILRKMCKISQEASDRLMKHECKLIENFSFPRESGKKLFREAKNQKKKVVITADTLYPEDVVKNILEKCGYSAYDALIMPKTMNIPDNDKNALFSAAVKKVSLPAKKIIHIGPNVEDDVEIPIMNGAKALLLAQSVPLMVRSGRLRGYIQNEKFYDYEKSEYLALHCIFGLYAAYGFDIPQNKTVHSDFCSDEYMIGFIVLGPLELIKENDLTGGLQFRIITALKRNPKVIDGRDDFIAMFDAHFGNFLNKFSYSGCELPSKFFEYHAASGDREAALSYLSNDDISKWTEEVSEPEIAPVYARAVKKNFLSKLADTLFPRGSKIRTILDLLLSKMHR